TLSNWRSSVPRLALEAVLLSRARERLDVNSGVEELARSSLIEITESDKDHEIFLSVPFVASLFGKRKLSVSPSKHDVESDTEILREFGAAQQVDIRHGIAPRVQRLFSS